MVASHPKLQEGLTPEQKALAEQLKNEVAPIVQKHPCLMAFCNEHTYVRYLRARSWNLAKAHKMLVDTLHWRLEYKPHLIKFEEVAEEATTGKQFIYPARDKAGRPIVMMRPRFENTKPSDRQTRYLIYNLEQASRIADETGIGKMTWLLDFEGYSLSNAPPLKTSMQCNHILQHHYPERLGLAVCYHAPTLFTFTWKAVGPFIDPVTKEKIKFISKGPTEKPDMEAKFHMEEMEACLGGAKPDYVFKYDTTAAEGRAFDATVADELRLLETQAALAEAKLENKGAVVAAEGTGAAANAADVVTVADDESIGKPVAAVAAS